MTTVIKRIAQLCVAIKNCEERGNTHWEIIHKQTLDDLVKSYLPSGSGFDSGTEVDIVNTTSKKVVLKASFHHMKEGMYIKWTDHTVTITPDFTRDYDIKISGPNYKEFRDYTYDLFNDILGREVEEN
jgi:hypothetical protein